MFHESEFEEEPEEIVDLGEPVHDPFEPPRNYRFEAEFDPPVPRPCPPEVRWGRYATLQRRQVSGLLIAGAMCMAVSKLRFVENLSNYILPLQFLLPFGLFLGTCGIGMILWRRSHSGRYRYVIEGEPIVAQIRRLELQVAAMTRKTPTAYHLFVKLMYRDPRNGETTTSFHVSSQIGSGQRTVLRSSYRVGDFVTAVFLPKNPDEPPSLYGFLELRHDIGVVVAEGQVLDSAPRMFAAMFAFVAFLSAIIGMIYSLKYLGPIEIPASDVLKCFALGAIVLGIPWCLFVRWLTVGRLKNAAISEEPADERPGDPIKLTPEEVTAFGKTTRLFMAFLMLGFAVLSGSITYTGFLAINALADRSPAVWKPIWVERLNVNTRRGMVREYEVKYYFRGNPGETHTQGSSPEEMAGLIAGRPYRAEVHAGYLGWPWVKSIAR